MRASLAAGVAFVMLSLPACGRYVTKHAANGRFIARPPVEVAVQLERARPDLRRCAGDAPGPCFEREELRCRTDDGWTETKCAREAQDYRRDEYGNLVHSPGTCLEWKETHHPPKRVCERESHRLVLQPISASWCQQCTSIIYTVGGHIEAPDFLFEDAWFNTHRSTEVPSLQRRMAGMGTYLETPAVVYVETLNADVTDADATRAAAATRVRVAPLEFRVGGGKYDFHLEALEVMSPTGDGHPWTGTWGPSLGLSRAIGGRDGLLLRAPNVRLSIGYSVGLYDDGISIDPGEDGMSVFHRVQGFRHGPLAGLAVYPLRTWNLGLRVSARYELVWAKHVQRLYSEAEDGGMADGPSESGGARRVMVRAYVHVPIGVWALAVTTGVQVAWVAYDYPGLVATQRGVAPFVGVGFGW